MAYQDTAEELLQKVQNSKSHEDAIKIILEFLNAIAEESRDDGYADGYTEGESTGYDEGYEAGKEEAASA